MLVEEGGKRLLIDPGTLTVGAHPTAGIDAVLITHEHADHLHVPSLQAVMKDSPDAKVSSIRSVGDLLAKEGVAGFSVVRHGDALDEGGVRIECIGEKHAVMHTDIPPSDNTGFLIAGRFFFPGDAFTLPGKPVEILALPIAGPWMKLSEAVDYARAVRPEICFPVHDGIVVEAVRPMLSVGMPKRLLEAGGIRYVALEEGKAQEF
jgi:L-ascorbate metabolism protein UlaG (beta-lactamase superfamily)